MSAERGVTVPGHKYPTTLAHGRYAIVCDVAVAQQKRTLDKARASLKLYPAGFRIYDLVDQKFI